MDKKQSDLKPSLQWIERLTHVMDTAIRVPGTNIRFGLDAIVGLIPFYGELVTYGVSASMVLAMVKDGVSGKVVVLMVWNVIKDSIIGSIPFIGDIYDIGNKANVRNLKLLKEHQAEGKHTGSGIGTILLVLGAFVGVFVLLVMFIIYGVAWLWSQLNVPL